MELEKEESVRGKERRNVFADANDEPMCAKKVLSIVISSTSANTFRRSLIF